MKIVFLVTHCITGQDEVYDKRPSKKQIKTDFSCYDTDSIAIEKKEIKKVWKIKTKS